MRLLFALLVAGTLEFQTSTLHHLLEAIRCSGICH